MTLPKIERPSRLINSDDKYSLDIQGRSRDGNGNGQLITRGKKRILDTRILWILVDPMDPSGS